MYTDHLLDAEEFLTCCCCFYRIIGFVGARVEGKTGEVSLSDSESFKHTEASDFICILFVYIAGV